MPQQRAGRQHAMESQQEDVVCSVNEKTHKCLRIFSHKTGYTNIFENHGAQSHSSPGGQHLTYLLKIGGTQNLVKVRIQIRTQN